MTFCDLTIYNDNPLLIRLCTELDLLPNLEWFPWNICDGCGMPTGDAYSSGHVVPSLWDLHMFYLLRPILFPNLSLFYRNMLFEYPLVLSRFCFCLFSMIDLTRFIFNSASKRVVCFGKNKPQQHVKEVFRYEMDGG